MTKTIPLSQGKVALVDDEDFEWLSQWKWTYSKHYSTGYAYRNPSSTGLVTRSKVYMHRAILSPPQGREIDHINGDGLDNRRWNLRICTHAQNLWNSRKRKGTISQYKGVRLMKGSGNWVSYIGQKYLGSFDNEETAASAYNQAARQYRGEFARLNPVPDRDVRPKALKRQGQHTSSYVGVSWSCRYQCWRAEIRINYELIWLGHFDSEEDAARVWNAAALRYRGSKARLNMLPETMLEPV